MKTALIVGINGMDARTLAKILLKKSYKVIGTFRRNTFSVTELHSFFDNSSHISFKYCDINDFNSVKSLYDHQDKIDETYLLAAQSHVGFSFNSSSQSVLTNGMSAYNFLESIKLYSPSTKLYFAATSELFGGAGSGIYDESSPFDCRSPYAIGKELGTRFVKYYRQLGLFCCYGILFNHSNTLRSPDFFIRRVTQAAARIATGKQKELILGNLDFWRDEHWADLGCKMMWKMLQRETPGDFVIANGETHHGTEYLDEAFGCFNLSWKDYVKQDKSRFRQNEVVRLIGDSSLAQKELGWKPNHISFKKHIQMMCQNDYNLEVTKEGIFPDVFT